MTTIGYATLAIIPSLKGVSEGIDKQLGFLPGQGTAAGKKLGSNIAAGVRGSEAQISAALAQAVNARGGEKVGQEWADNTASAMAKHLQSAQNTQKLTSSLAFLQKNGDEAGRGFAENMANRLGIDLPAKTKAQRIGERIGQVIAAPLGLAIRGGLLAATGAAAAGVAGIGYVLTKGFERLESIDQATFKLKALGHSGDETKQIMDNALASVKGTAFSLADSATAAASAVAAGIKPGQDLTKYLTEVGDAASVAGTNFDDMGHIFNKIQTSNKAYTDDLNQLSDRGLPIFKWLQDEYGVTADQLTKMVEKGEVDSAHFQDVISKNIGGAAQKLGQSFDGAVQNLEASTARLGANLITAILGGDQNGDALAGPTKAIGNLTDKFDEIGKWVQAHSGEIHDFFEDIKNVAVKVGSAVKDIGTWLVNNKQFAEDLALVFIGWKVATTILGVVDKLKEMGLIMRTQLPKDAEAGASGISKAFSFIVIPAIAQQLNDQLQQWLKDNHPALSDANNSNTPDQLGKNARDWVDRTFAPPVPSLKQTPGSAPGAPPAAAITPGPAVAPSATYDPNNPLLFPYGRATGGSILGSGTATSDSIPAWLSNGEHVLTAKDVSAMGGQGGVYAFRSMLHRAGGGDIPLGNVAAPGRSWWQMPFMPNAPGDPGVHHGGPSWARRPGHEHIMIPPWWWQGGPNEFPHDPTSSQEPTIPFAIGGAIRGFAGGGPIQWMDIIKLGGTGDAAPGSADDPGGDTGKRSWFGTRPRTKVWGQWENGIMRGPRPSTSGPAHGFRDRDWPWWMFPGDQPSVGTPGPDRDHRRDIFLGPHPSIIGGPGGHKLPSDRRYNPPPSIWNPSPSDPGWKRRPGTTVPTAWRRFAGGGAVGPDVSAAEQLVGAAYSQGGRFDCSGDVARVINAALGIDGSGLMTTKTAQSWLAARGFVDGLGGPGQISVGWYDHGPNPNDGHMAMTLSDGRPAEGGGSHGAFLVGAGASGANSAQFDHHMHLAVAKALAPVAAAAGNAAAPATGTGNGEGAPTSGGSSGGVGPLPSSISGLSSFGLAGLGSGVGTTGSGSDLSVFGNAAASAVSGQVSSALGVFGVGDNPPFLQAASKLLSGIKVGGHAGPGKSDGSIFNGANPLGSFGQGSAGSSAVPLSASSTATGTPPPDDAGNMHGTRAGQAPGPQVVYNIRTATVDDAFLAAQRKENVRMAAKLSKWQ